ncbi:hypothetical protein TYRP_001573, partial [Tyrophagus putrescentiae]
MPPSYDTDVVTVVFRKLRSLLMVAHSSEGQTINTKLFYMIFLAIRIKYMFHEHHSHPKIKVPKSITLITAGSMRIGIATKKMDIREKIGQNGISIGIDGFKRCVVMNNKKHFFDTYMPRWKINDVI